MRRTAWIFFFLSLSLGWNLAQAKDKVPKDYQQGKLLNVEERDTVETSYITKKQSDGSTLTVPQNNTVKHYFITVQVEDMVYVGEYTPAFFGKPGDWVIGDPISLRFDKNNMILQKPNGKELKAKIRKRIRAAEAASAAPSNSGGQ